MAERAGLFRNLTDKPGLAHPGLTVDQDSRGLPLGGAGQRLAKQSLFGNLPREQCARDVPRIAHLRSVTAPSRFH